MKSTLATVAVALAGVATAAHEEGTFAVLRFTNKQLTKGRMDPILFPGQTSTHVHTIMGGSGFSKSSTGKDLLKSKCSNALVKGDNSNYWFPAMYFHDPKTGKFEDVEFNYFNAYYFFEKTHDDIKPFPVGLQIVAGDSMTRTMPKTGSKPNLDPSKGATNAARITCPRLHNIFEPPSWSPDSDGSLAGVGDPVNLGEGVGFPDRTCDGENSPLRADVHFPSCYNPKAGLTNFKENMAYPEDNGGYLDCPKGWIHVPHLFYEAYWHTEKFAGRWEEGKGKQPFVFSNGDVTGYSNHADFMAGWDEDLLQHIIDTCDTGVNGMDNCPGLTYGLNKDDCTIESDVDEKVDGTLSKLPGNNPLSGWSYGDSVGSGSSSGGDDESSSTKPAPRPSATDYPSGDKTTAVELPSGTDAASSATIEAAQDKTTDLPEEATEAADAVSTSQSAAQSKATGVLTNAPKPTDVFGKPGKKCKSRTHTVWNTVTVTQTAPSNPAQTEATAPVYKRDPVRRHAHNHGSGHGHGHLRRRSHRH